MRQWTCLICAALFLGLFPQAPAEASGGSSAPAAPMPSAAPPQTPEEAGKTAYNLGLKHRDKAWALEKKAVDNKKGDKLLAKAEGQWTKAVVAFQESIANDPLMHQAHGSLGYAYRQLGRYEESLEAYDHALEITPGYVEAIEYRAEAYLGLSL